MNLKFLPVGSVCLVEGVNKKQMIIGYLKSGYDYVAVEYPKGFETDNKLSYFNHEQVKELYSLGYKNEESRIYTGTLVSSNMNSSVSDEDELEEKAITPTSEIEELKFDENGVVVSDGESTLEEVQPLTNLQFDENGVVISDGESTIEKQEDKKTETKLQFDENGVVISDGESILEKQEDKKAETKLQFDENGVVISDGESTLEKQEDKKTETKLQFDENGVTILDDAATIDVSDVVKQIEETVKESEKNKKSDSESSKKEKRGLFHFGRK